MPHTNDFCIGRNGTFLVARQLEQFRKDFVCTHLIMSTQLPGLDPKKATASLELFAKEIMPSLRK